MASAALDASRLNRPRAAIAPATINVDASSTMSCPTPNPGGGTGMLPTIPPIALACPPPSALLVSHGSQALIASTAAHRATSQPGRSRAMVVRLSAVLRRPRQCVVGDVDPAVQRRRQMRSILEELEVRRCGRAAIAIEVLVDHRIWREVVAAPG